MTGLMCPNWLNKAEKHTHAERKRERGGERGGNKGMIKHKRGRLGTSVSIM